MPSYHILSNTGHPDAAANAPALSMNEVMQLTFDLTFLHYKCPRSISVPSPVYLADLAAERATSLYTNDHFYGADFDEEQSRRLFY